MPLQQWQLLITASELDEFVTYLFDVQCLGKFFHVDEAIFPYYLAELLFESRQPFCVFIRTVKYSIMRYSQ